MPNVLYHYTCAKHGMNGIKNIHKILPYMQPMLGRPLLWLTDLDTPDVWALGLTSNFLCCDRTEIRVSVAPYDSFGNTDVEPWWHYAKHRMDRFLRELYEETGLCMHWYVSEKPVRATGMIATSVLQAMPTQEAAHE